MEAIHACTIHYTQTHTQIIGSSVPHVRPSHTRHKQLTHVTVRLDQEHHDDVEKGQEKERGRKGEGERDREREKGRGEGEREREKSGRKGEEREKGRGEEESERKKGT